MAASAQAPALASHHAHFPLRHRSSANSAQSRSGQTLLTRCTSFSICLTSFFRHKLSQTACKVCFLFVTKFYKLTAAASSPRTSAMLPEELYAFVSILPRCRDSQGRVALSCTLGHTGGRIAAVFLFCPALSSFRESPLFLVAKFYEMSICAYVFAFYALLSVGVVLQDSILIARKSHL